MKGTAADIDILEVAMDAWTIVVGTPAPDPEHEDWEAFEVMWQRVDRLWVPGGHRRALLHAAIADWTPVGSMELPPEVTVRWAQPAALPSIMLH